MVTLIGNDVRNGSFELLNGFPNAAKATHWDTDPDGDVDNWTVWPGESTAENDSGTEATGATHGSKAAFLQNGNAVYNLTNYVAKVGDAVALRFDHPGGGAAIRAGIVYNSGTIGAPVISRLTAAELALTATGNNKYLIYVIPAGSPAIGKAIGVASSQPAASRKLTVSA